MTLKSHSAQTWFLILIWAPPKLTVNAAMNSSWIWFITMICHVSVNMMFDCSVQSESKSLNRRSEAFFVQPIIFQCCCTSRRTCPSGFLVPLSKSEAGSISIYLSQLGFHAWWSSLSLCQWASARRSASRLLLLLHSPIHSAESNCTPGFHLLSESAFKFMLDFTGFTMITERPNRAIHKPRARRI